MENLIAAMAAYSSALILVAQLLWRLKKAVRSHEVVIKIAGDPNGAQTPDRKGNFYSLDELKIADINKLSESEWKDMALWLEAAGGNVEALAEVRRRNIGKATQ